VYLKAIGWWGMTWIHLCQDRVKLQAVANICAIECGEFVDQLWNFCAFKKDSAVWR